MRKGLFPAALLLLACSHTPPAPNPVPARGPARDSLIASDLARADSVRARGPVAGFAAWLSRDVVYLRAGTFAVRGREAVLTLLADTSDVPGALAWEPLGGDVSADHLSGYTYGVATRARADTVTLERYIAFWQRGAPGSAGWRLAAYVEVGSPYRARQSDTVVPTPSGPGGVASGAAGRGVAALISADSAFSDLADRIGVGPAFTATVAPHGVIFAGTEIVTGPAAVRDYYATRDAAAGLAWHPVSAMIAGSGDLGFTVGRYIFTGRGPSGAAVQSFGKYLTVWQRQPDGTWKFVVDGGNPSPAPRAELRR